MKIVKPSQLREWNEIKDKPHHKHKNPHLYGWYYDELCGMWFPHRKPTLIELEYNRFVT